MAEPVDRHWHQRFEAFARKKAEEARRAEMPGYVTDVDHSYAFDVIEIGGPASRALFDGPFFMSQNDDPDLPLVNLVFVQSKPADGAAFGNTGAKNPEDLGGGATDKHLIYEGLSRVAVDAVLVGDRTLRGSDVILSVWLPELVERRTTVFHQPRHPAQVLVTGAGTVDPDETLLFNAPSVPVYVLTTHHGAERLGPKVASRRHVTVVATGDGLNLRTGLGVLRDAFHIRSVSAVGGRTVATTLIEEGLVRDVYLTTSPIEGGEPNTPFYAGTRPLRPRLVLRKKGKGSEAGTTFEHLTLQN